MSHAAPWSIKGIDPSTRDAARLAARRAGMTVAEWLDHVIREGAAPEPYEDDIEDEDSLDDIADRLERLSRMSTAAAPISPARTKMNRNEISALVHEASSRRTRVEQNKTAGALDAIARWMETTDQRLQGAQHIANEQNERTAALVAEAVRTMSDRLVDIERRSSGRSETGGQFGSAGTSSMQSSGLRGAQMRPSLSRDNLSAAIVDIRSRQRDLDAAASNQARAQQAQAFGASSAGATLHHLKDELRTLSQTVSAIAQPAQTAQFGQPGFVERRSGMQQPQVEAALRDIMSKLGEIKSPPQIDSLTRTMSRIEAEVSRLSSRKPDGMEKELLRAIERLDGKIDRLASASDLVPFADAARDLGDLKSMMRHGVGVDQELGGQLSLLAGELTRMRELSAQGEDIGGLRNAVDEVRSMLAQERNGDKDIASQIESLARRLDDVNAVTSVELHERLEALAARIQLNAAKGMMIDPALDRRLETLLIRMDDLAGRDVGAGSRIEEQLSALQHRIEQLSGRDTSKIETQIDALSARLEHLAASTSLAAVTNDKPHFASPPLPDLKPIESMLASLHARFEDAQRPDATQAHFSALERQVAKLAERLDQQGASQTSGLERSLQDLVGTVTSLRNEAHLSAERAAERVVSAHLDELRVQPVVMPEAAKDALAAVQGSLEKIVSRLTQLEDDLLQGRHAAPVVPMATSMAQPMPAQPAIQGFEPQATYPHQEPMPQVFPSFQSAQLPERTLAPDMPVMHQPDRSRIGSQAPDGFDLPLEPGSGRPVSAVLPGEGGPAAVVGAADAAVKASFIAAARRAALAAQEAHSQSEPKAAEKSGSLFARFSRSGKGKNDGKMPVQSPVEPVLAGEAGADVRTVSAVREAARSAPATKGSGKRKPVLLLSLAALILAVGAFHVMAPQPTAPAAPSTTPKANPAADASADAARGQQGAVREQAPAKKTELSAPVQTASPAASAAEEPGATGSAGALLGPGPAQAAAKAIPSLAVPLQAAPEAAAPRLMVTDLPDLPTNGIPAPLRQAASSGDAIAVYDLATRLADGRGVVRDPKLALRLFERAAAAGLVPAQFRLGNMHEKAIGTSRDVALARQWYERAASKGNAKAMHNLAVLFAEGASGRPDYAEAANWFNRAAELGVRDSQFNLAVLQARGLGTAQDLIQSYTWFAVAAKGGDEEAAKKRDEVAAQLGNADLSLAKAAVDQWRPKLLDAGANEVVVSPVVSDEGAAGQRKPAKGNKTS